ncbi:MAG TPA: UMP kinase [Candidatus Pacearchaeota archaeon]|nr:UMP kinase [Candidatus Pacearchaeota archaeon]HPR80207.1 UMP kinase [Candidatus Pacearchaeota archaeon]
MKKYKRILLKIGGESFGKEDGRGVSLSSYMKIAKEIVDIKKKNNVDLCIVIGGGNIFRGREIGEEHFDKVTADYMGMLSTIINGLGLEEALESLGVPSKLMSSIEMDKVCESFSKKKAIEYLNQGKIVVFAGGTGNPFFTTDTLAALRSCEIDCDLILKATNVDGVYNKDPKKYSDAKLYENLTFEEALEKKLNVMDLTAFALCLDNQKPIIVFNIKKFKDISKALKGEKFGTFIG